jgi:hypothetical protein
MSAHINHSLETRAPKSSFDHHAIHMAGHLLLAGIWLERLLRHAPRLQIRSVESGWARPPGHISRTRPLQFHPARIEES